MKPYTNIKELIESVEEIIGENNKIVAAWKEYSWFVLEISRTNKWVPGFRIKVRLPV